MRKMGLRRKLQMMFIFTLLFMFLSLMSINNKTNCKSFDQLLKEYKSMSKSAPFWRDMDLKAGAQQLFSMTLKNSNTKAPVKSSAKSKLISFFNRYKNKGKYNESSYLATYFNDYKNFNSSRAKEEPRISLDVLAPRRLLQAPSEAKSSVLHSEELDECDMFPESLVGLLKISSSPKILPNLSAILPDVTSHGEWSPPFCTARQRIAVIVPHMNRSEHLPVFLNHIHSLLHRQQMSYRIYIVEQISPSIFNRGAILNAGFSAIFSRQSYDCAVFHDVDMLAEHDHNLYACGEHPLHLSPHVDTLQYCAPGRRLGGVVAIRPQHFRRVNGYSNAFWGWGGEDDDLYLRFLKWRKIPIERARKNVGRYTMLRHTRDVHNPLNPNRLRGAVFRGTRYEQDGLNSLVFSVDNISEHRLYTKIAIHLHPPGEGLEL